MMEKIKEKLENPGDWLRVREYLKEYYPFLWLMSRMCDYSSDNIRKDKDLIENIERWLEQEKKTYNFIYEV